MEKHFTSSVIIIKNKKVLLLWHKKLNTWLYPGGHLEENETPDETAIREAKEETNLDIEVFNNCNFKFESNNVRILNNPYVIMEEEINDSNGKHYHIDMVYLAIPQRDNEIVIKKEESKEYGWFSYEQIIDMNLLPNLKALLIQVFKEIQNGKIVLKENWKNNDFER